MIEDIKSEIQCLRNYIGVEFQRWHDEAKHLASCVVLKKKYEGFTVIGPADTPFSLLEETKWHSLY